jgi:hypothetical protein
MSDKFGLSPNPNTGLESQLQEILKSLNKINQTLAALFPNAATAVTTSFTNGTFAAMPTQYEAMLTVTIAGVAYKIPMVKV